MKHHKTQGTTATTKERKRVWIALADVFLDTDVSLHYQAISKQCAVSHYSIDELESILINEVAPVCYDNLNCVAGQWSGFDEDWLITKITDNIKQKTPVLTKLWQWICALIHKSYIHQHWKNIVLLIVEYRTQNTGP